MSRTTARPRTRPTTITACNMRKARKTSTFGARMQPSVATLNAIQERLDDLQYFAEENGDFEGEAERQGLDPNVWFDNVEVIAARRIGRETVQYVSNIYKYYISYKLAQDKAGRGKGQPKRI